MKKKRVWIVVLALMMVLGGMMTTSGDLFAEDAANGTVSADTSDQVKGKIDPGLETMASGNDAGDVKTDDMKKEDVVTDAQTPGEAEPVEAEKASTEATAAEPAEEAAKTPGKTEVAEAEKVPAEATVAEPVIRNIAKAPASPVSVIYLNGESGDDSKDGTSKENAVKSFARAKEIATQNQKVDTIYVLGTVEVSGDISLKGTNAIVKRDPGFGGFLFMVKKDATLSDITIDGNQANVTARPPVRSLVAVLGKVTITDGTVIQNNLCQSPGQISFGGGVLVAGSLAMTGGVIQNNTATWGGGLCILSNSSTISGGTIQNNHAVGDPGDPGVKGHGGGICMWTQSRQAATTLTVENAACIQKNDADYAGGGIAVGTHYSGKSAISLIMTGGKITENTAGSGGGGILIQEGKIGKAGSADISGGEITNNQMTGQGKVDMDFGGGGIYVNGSNRTGYQNGFLHLTNAIIRNNMATLEGGGVAACPVTQTRIYLTDGAAIYGNSGSGAKDLYLEASDNRGVHSGTPSYTISNSMLGGKPYHWQDDDGNEIPLNKLEGTLEENTHLSLHTDETGDQTALSLAKVLILGNTSATKGGAIGSNGTVRIGTEETTTISVTKKWQGDEGGSRPASITVDLYRGEEGSEEEPIYIGGETIQPDHDGNWLLTFTNLPKKDKNGKDYTYTVKEKEVAGYVAVSSGNQQDGFILTNTFVGSMSVPVTKKWIGTPTASILVHLYADGEEIESHTLSEENQWKYTFENLPQYKDGAEIQYTVSEDKVEGYSAKITGDAGTGYIITNTKDKPPVPGKDKPKPPNDTPETGDTVNPAVYAGGLVLSAGLLLAAWFSMRRKASKESERSQA